MTSDPANDDAGIALALVADDLTGALDASAPFAGCGFAVRVFRTVAALEAAGAATSNAASRRVMAVSTASRHLAPDAARREVEAAGRLLQRYAPKLIFKKIDSTLRGPVPEEVRAAMDVFKRPSALVCPAFPAAGRVVRGGEVLVHGTVLRETEYAKDLRTPAPDIPPAAFLERAGPVQLFGINPSVPEKLAPGVILADAETDGHLERLASIVAAHPDEMLASGSDGLATGLAHHLRDAVEWGEAWSGAPREEEKAGYREGDDRITLFALGSRSETTERQLAVLRERYPDTMIMEAPAGELDAQAVARAAEKTRAIVAWIPPEPQGEPDAVVRRFARGVRAAIEALGPERVAALVATGGDTVDAILDAREIGALDVQGEFRAGVPVSRAVGAWPEILIISKAGGFGTPELFAEIVAAAPLFGRG